METVKKVLGFLIVVVLIGGSYYWITRPMPELTIRGRTPMMKIKRPYDDLDRADRNEYVEYWLSDYHDGKLTISDYGYGYTKRTAVKHKYIWVEARYQGYTGYVFDDGYVDISWPNGKRY